MPFGGVNATVTDLGNNFRFSGQYFDNETRLHYNYHRYYAPDAGRYLTSDPSHSLQPEEAPIPYLVPFLLNAPAELSLYPYVLNNPINLVDPEGLIPLLSCAQAVSKAKKECGAKYQEAIKRAHDYLDWCEKAWWYCRFEGQYAPPGNELSPGECPSQEQCKKINVGLYAGDGRMACMDSSSFISYLKQTTKCSIAIFKVMKCAGF